MQGTELHIWMREPYVIFTFGGDLLSTHAVWQTRKCDFQVDTQWIEFQWLPCGMKLFSSFTLVGSYNIFQQVGKGDLSILVFKFWSQRSPTSVGRGKQYHGNLLARFIFSFSHPETRIWHFIVWIGCKTKNYF